MSPVISAGLLKKQGGIFNTARVERAFDTSG
jgi:hypothetical protein